MLDTNMTTHISTSVFLVFSIFLGYGLSEDTQSCTVQPIPNGDAHVIFVSSSEADCTSNSESSKLVRNARRILENINQQQTVKFGLQVLSICSTDPKSRLRVGAEISRQVLEADSCSKVVVNVVDQNSTLVGILDNVGLLDIQQILAGTNIPIIYIGETAATPAENVYFTSNPLSQEIRAKAIAELAVKLNWDYITVVYGSDSTSQDLKLLLEKQLEENFVCVDEFIEFSQSSSGLQLAETVSGSGKPRGVILLGIPDKTNITHKMNRDLTWIVSPQLPVKEDYMFIRSRLDKAYILRQYQSTTLNIAGLDQVAAALHTVTKSFQEIVNEECSGQLSTCPNMGVEELQKLTNNRLKSVVVSYEEVNSSEIFDNENSGSFRFVNRVLRHSSPPLLYSLSLPIEGKLPEYGVPDGWNVDGTSQNSSKFWCTNEDCRKKCSQQITPNNYIYVPGDYIIIVTEPIHDSFNQYPDLWSCVNFNSEASLRAEAALYARDRLNILFNDKGIHFGLLVLDTCFNTALTQKLLTDVLNGTTEYCYKGDCLDRSKIIGLVGDYSSHVSFAEQRLMMPANILQVAYGASTWKLDDKSEFSHFLRTHPSFTRLIANLIKVLDNLNSNGLAEVNSVVLIHTNSLFGKSSAELLRNLLNESSYCVQETFELDYINKETSDIYQKLWSQLSGERGFVVIYVGEEKPITDLLDAMSGQTIAWWRQSGSIFMMTEVWEDRISLLQRYGSVLRGSLTFKLLPDFGVTEFQEHFLDLRPHASDRNPWFRKMYQLERSCKVRGSFETSSSIICPQDQPYVGADGKISIEIYALFVIKSIYALGYGFRDYAVAVKECEDYIGNCDKLYERTYESSQELKFYVGKVTIPINDNSTLRDGVYGSQPFDKNLDGRSGYQVFSQQIMLDSSDLKYVLVYEFNEENELLIPDPSTPPKFYIQEESREVDYVQEKLISTNCQLQCEAYCTPETTNVVPTTEPRKATPELTIIAVCTGTVIAILLVAIIILVLKKNGNICRGGAEKSKSESTYGSDNYNEYMRPDGGEYTLPREPGVNNGAFIDMSRQSSQVTVRGLPSLPPTPTAPIPAQSALYTGGGVFLNNDSYDNGVIAGSRNQSSINRGGQVTSMYLVPEVSSVSNSQTYETRSTAILPPTPLPRQNSLDVVTNISIEASPSEYINN